ncbi:MAG: HEAT repeat domain-containing protein [candidate division Zixibacteria bacterium]|nr:HEAT repeat domain-containing protein [candidate division Zixibacteria bacterium]MDH3936619.1 HEAT repeat domain-containing protein [candidate division Zixibacteria bacterium]MDH4035000.1 HEAT repeat domain-containing protein [candidate division Zixibacteria bacterium]
MATICLLLLGMVTQSQASGSVQQKFDSLFMIASSGEVQFRDMVEPAKDSIAAMGVEVVPHLIDKFTTKSARERWTVIHVLKRIGSPAVPLLVEALNLSDGLVVQRVCWALGDIADSAAVQPLIEVRHHPRWQVRDQAIGALGKIGDRAAASVVVEALLDSIGQVRKAAAVSAGKLAANSGIARLVHLLSDGFYGARLSAEHSLLSLDTAAVVEALTDSIDASDPLLGSLSCRILGRLGTPRCVAVLLAQAHSAVPDRRAHAVLALTHAAGDNGSKVSEFFAEREPDRLARLKMISATGSLAHER